MNLKIMANSKRPILIEGETGVGKTRLAKKIYSISNNSNRKFIQINMAAISNDLFESELFGHRKGSFTGATEEKKGFCEIISNGVLFLDEIGELSLEKQASLLTLIDENIFYKVGSTEALNFKGKLIFATNRNLEQMVELGTFRKDLYFRLRFFHIVLPVLRENTNLKELIWNEFQNLKVEKGHYNICMETNVLERLSNYCWPGNYRELLSTLEYFLEIGSARITLDDIPSWIRTSNSKSIQFSNIYKTAYIDFEKDFLITQLKKNNGKINLTSNMTGINKVTLISKLKKYDINRKDYLISQYRQVNGF